MHGFSKVEQDRLWQQAELFEQTIYQDIDFSHHKHVLEVGSGVGAQSAILLRRFPKIQLLGLDMNPAQIQAARQNLERLSYCQGRYQFCEMDATQIEVDVGKYDAAFLCWVLEHIPEPQKVLKEVRRVLLPGSRIIVTEVMNSSFFIEPYSPNLWRYWMAFNDFQYDRAGDPFIGAKLGNLLLSLGFQSIQTTVKTWFYDKRLPQHRKEAICFWKELMLSASDVLLEAGAVTSGEVHAMQKEFMQVESDPNSVIFYAFMQANALT
jgi:ubiquinone/menaquinone biosynthesis C-methylase UbiE